MNELNYDTGVYRTAPATPGQLNNLSEKIENSYYKNQYKAAPKKTLKSWVWSNYIFLFSIISQNKTI